MLLSIDVAVYEMKIVKISIFIEFENTLVKKTLSLSEWMFKRYKINTVLISLILVSTFDWSRCYFVQYSNYKYNSQCWILFKYSKQRLPQSWLPEDGEASKLRRRNPQRGRWDALSLGSISCGMHRRPNVYSDLINQCCSIVVLQFQLRAHVVLIAFVTL